MTWQATLLRWSLRLSKKVQGREPVPPAEVRRRLKRLERIVPGPPAGTETSMVDAGGIPAVRIKVSQAREDRCVLYFHGGGYVIGSPPLFRDFTWRIGRAARACVLFFDYRLAPEHRFPAALDDAIAAYGWLAAQFDPQRIAFVGDSAGGGLALATLLKLRDESRALPGAAVALSPWTDLALTGPSLQSNAAADPILDMPAIVKRSYDYLGDADPRNPYASPLYGDASGLPPILIHVGGDEILRDDAVRMADKLKAAGSEAEIDVWPRLPHVWHFYARLLPEAREAIARIGAFLERRM
ncbi:MAG TPA: alpha/beta hydrolase [Xanthobacteraceae bacterium]|jgi:acetyl esterase/lipase